MLSIYVFVAMVDQIERYVHSQIQCHWVDFVDHNAWAPAGIFVGGSEPQKGPPQDEKGPPPPKKKLC